jgi:hypothetical protein
MNLKMNGERCCGFDYRRSLENHLDPGSEPSEKKREVDGTSRVNLTEREVDGTYKNNEEGRELEMNSVEGFDSI